MSDYAERTNRVIEILAVEDSPTQAEHLRYLLEEGGYTVTVAPNGLLALDAARRRKPSLIISDIVMPQMDGYQLCREIKADVALKDIPVVLITSLSSPQDVIKGLECGADSFIRKPYDERYLLSRIEYLRANQALRQKEQTQLGLEIYLGGQRHFITAERQQIFDLLVSTYEEAVRLNEGLNRSNEWLHGLYRMAEGLNQAQDEREVCDISLTAAVELPGVRAGWIFLREGESNIRLAAVSGSPSALSDPHVPAGDCYCCRVLLGGELIQATHILECERMQRADSGENASCYHASIPLWSGSRVFGVMNLIGEDPTLFGDDDLAILNGVGNQIGIALERAHLRTHLEEMVAARTAALAAEVIERKLAEEEGRRQAARAEALVRSAGRVNAHLDLDTILAAICEETAQALHAPAVSLSLYDAERDRFEYAADFGLPPEYRRQLWPLRRAAMAGADASLPGVLPDADLDTAYGIHPALAVDLVHAQELIGRLTVHAGEAAPINGGDEQSLLQGLGDQAVQAIVNARLFAEAQRRLELLHALHAIDNAIIAVPDMAGTLDTIFRQITAQLKVDAVDVMLFDRQTKELSYAAGAGFDHEITWQTRWRLGEGYVGRVAAERQRVFVPNLQVAGFGRPALVHTEEFVSYSAVPLVVQDELRGVLEVFRRTEIDPRPEWVEAFQALALQTAIAIDHADLFAQTRHLLRRTQEQARQLEQIMDTVPEGVVFLDENFTVQIANQVAESHLASLAGAKVGEALVALGGRAITDIIDDPQSGKWQELVVADGKQVFEFAVRPMQGNLPVGGWVLVLREVTEDRQRRQHMLVQDRLATVGQLAAGIAHDFNNLLTPILLYTEMNVADAPKGSLLRENLEQVLLASNRARDLVYQILAFSRQGATQERKPILLRPYIKEVLKLMQAVLPSTISVREMIEEEKGNVIANPVQIQQIIMNLCTNAYHAMRQRGGTLTVKLDTYAADADFAARRAHLHPGTYARMTVSDTGHGMTASTMEHIFDPFFTTKAAGEGTGMGLSVVYGIVMSHDGDITVESAPGQGSSFQIYFPQIVGVTASEAGAPLEISGGNKQLLLVDDEESIVRVTKMVLENLGYTVTDFTDSVAALAEFRQQPDRFDLVITDLTMPAMTGNALAQAVHDLRPDVPILLVSGAHETLQNEATEISGKLDTLMKPFLMSELAKKVHRLLSADADRE